MRVKVTFHLNPDDPEHPTGLTQSTWDEVSAALEAVGAFDIEVKGVPDPPLRPPAVK